MIKYVSIGFLASFFIYITIVGLRDCPKPAKKEPDMICESEFTQSADHETWRDNFKVLK